MKKKLLYFSPLLILMALIIIISFSIISSIKKEQVANINFSSKKVVLPEFNLPDLWHKNQSFTNADLKGKYSLINVFASWCTTCLAEHKTLLKLKEKNLIKIYGITWNDIDINTKKFLKKHGNPYEKVAIDNKEFLTGKLGLRAVPESFLVNSQGDIIFRIQGNITEEFIQRLEKLLQN